MIYTHAVVRLTVNGKQYKGSAEFPRPTTESRLYEHLYEVAKRDLQLLKPTGWIIVSPVFEVGDSEVLDASLEEGYLLKGGKEFFPNPAKAVKVIQA